MIFQATLLLTTIKHMLIIFELSIKIITCFVNFAILAIDDVILNTQSLTQRHHPPPHKGI